MEKCYISVDVEGSVGKAYPPVSSMVSLGACVIGEEYESYYVELKPLNDLWDPGAEKIHKLTREHLRIHGGEPTHVMPEFSRWVAGVSLGRAAVFCAKPIRYDWSYVRWYLNRFGVANPFVLTLDTRDLYKKMKGLPEATKIKRTRIWREFPTTLEHTHNALDDAKELAEVMEKMLRVASPEALQASLCDAQAYLIR